ncbi:MAG: MXAN_5187 C-terminal domain-containing protein [Polyangiaceae bacterium]
MRWKIIAVNSIIVLLVGVLSYALLRAGLGDLASNPTQLKAEAERALAAANGKLELDAVRTERWLATMANEKASREVFKGGTTSARQEEATEFANRLLSSAVGNPVFFQMTPTLVAIVDAGGILLGRNGTNLGRGEDLGAGHPSLKAAAAQGVTVTDVWADAKTSELMSVSYAPVRDDARNVLGLVIVGTPLNDGRLQRTAELTSGRGLILGIPAAANIDLKAKSTNVAPGLLSTVGQAPIKDTILGTVANGQGAFVPVSSADVLLTAAPLSGYGDGKRAVLIAVSPSSLIESISGLLWPVLAVTGLGVLLVCLGGFLLGNYISRPIEDLEEGLLQILNGKTDLRFEIEHAELGGLVFRLNSLLNQLMGVQEDDTDDEGRPSRPPAASDFSDALAVDERQVSAASADPGLVAALKSEPADSYYRRLFRDYVAAKRSLGDPIDHITEPNFVGRIRTSEGEMKEKHGKPVRYRVETRGREVILIAVPLA